MTSRACNFVVVILWAVAVTGEGPVLLRDLPQDILEDYLTMYYNGTVRLREYCDSNNVTRKTEYWVYTPNNSQNPRIIYKADASIVSHGYQLIILAHGWQNGAYTERIVALKDAYMKRYQTTIVSIDWSYYSNKNYFCAYSAVPKIASDVANFIYQLSNFANISLSSIHGVGHSMGGQLLGIAASLIHKQYQQKIGRITGLDPAGPLYFGLHADSRLDRKDAHFVDIIHTSEAGYSSSAGHFDSYPNCGIYQPGCLKFAIKQDIFEDITSLLDLPLDVITCSHSRSAEYFTESISSGRFMARQCILCGLPLCFGNPFRNQTVLVGENCTKPGEERNYVFETNSSPPFAKG